MRKTILTVGLAVAAAALLGVGIVHAQGGQPPQGGRHFLDGTGPLHTYVAQSLADALDLDVEDVNARLAAGETAAQIALEEGVSQQDLGSLLSRVRADAVQQAVSAGVLSQAQADLMTQRMQGRFGIGDCPMGGPSGGQGGRMGRARAGMMAQGQQPSE